MMTERLSDEVRELELYIDNDGDLYRQMTTPIFKNLVNKMASGKYDRNLAVKAFEHLAEAGAKKYVKEFGGGAWHQMFPVAVRREFAVRARDAFEQEVKNGSYQNLLHKKNQIGRVGGKVRKTRLEELRESLPKGYTVETYSPGDGVTRYRFFRDASPKQTYFGPASGIYTALGMKEALAYANGLHR